MADFVIPAPPVPAIPVSGGGAFPVRRVYCIGRNYAAHAIEMGHDPNREPPFFFQKNPNNLTTGDSFPYPPQTKDVHHEIELVYSIRRHNGRAEADRVTIGLDLTARDVQQELKQKGLPWEKAKAFDGSAYVSEAFTAVESFPAGRHIEFMLKKNGRVVQSGHSGQMMHDAAALIAHVERYMLLENGDLLFTGTPAGVGPLSAGDRLEGYLLGELLFDMQVA